MVVTTLMPVPDDMPSWLPPAEKMIGTMLAMPKPQKAKAAMASQGDGRQAGDQHAGGGDKRRAAQRRHRAEAVAHAVAEEAHDGHDAGKGSVGKAGDGKVGTELLPEVQRRPVEHRALGDHGQQRHQADQVDQRVRAATRTSGARQPAACPRR